MTPRQLRALSDAAAEVNRSGLARAGNTWSTGRPNAEYHDNRTVQSLSDRGLLRFYARGTVAHVTDLGMEALALEREMPHG